MSNNIFIQLIESRNPGFKVLEKYVFVFVHEGKSYRRTLGNPMIKGLQNTGMLEMKHITILPSKEGDPTIFHCLGKPEQIVNLVSEYPGGVQDLLDDLTWFDLAIITKDGEFAVTIREIIEGKLQSKYKFGTFEFEREEWDPDDN